MTPLRWPLALAGGYLAFLGLLWLWCRWLLSRGEADGDWPLVLVQGDTVMAGYWRNPEATAAAIRWICPYME